MEQNINNKKLEIQTLIDEANTLFDAGNYQIARDRYKDILNNYTANFDDYFEILPHSEILIIRQRIGDCSYLLGDFYCAAEEYSHIGSLYEKLDEELADKISYFRRASALGASAFFDETKRDPAIKDYERVINLDPSFAPAYVGHAKLLFYPPYPYDHTLCCKNLKKAISDLTKAAELDHNRSEIYYNRAKANLHLGSVIEKKKATILYKKALEDCNTAIKLAPEYKDSYVLRGEIYHLRLGDSQQAIIEYTKVIKLDPENGEYYVARGKVYADLNRNQQAINDFTRAIEIYKKIIEQQNDDEFDTRDVDFGDNAYEARGSVYFSLGQYQQAVKDYSQAIEIFNYYYYYFLRSMCYEKLGDYSNASADHSKGLELHSSLSATISTKANLFNDVGIEYHNKGNYKVAIDYYSKAIDIDPEEAHAYHNRGLAQDSLGQEIKAIDDYKIAARLGNKNAQLILKSKGIGW